MATDVQRAAAALTSAGESCDFRSYAAAEAERLERVWWSTAQPALITLPAARLPAPLLVALAAEYPADFTVWLIRGDAAQPRPLGGLAEESGPGLLFLPPLPAETRRPDYAEFVQIIARLRAPDGCPWDRQQTLRGLIDWSYDLLDAREKALLLRLSVFRGGWTVEAAENVCSDELVGRLDVLDLLDSLVDKSLVVAGEEAGHARYLMLETVRDYAAERLEQDRGTAAWRDRQLAYFADLAEQAAPELVGGRNELAWLDRIEAEHDNLRAALDWASAKPDGAGEALRTAGHLSQFWEMRGHLSEGRARLESALKHSVDGQAAIINTGLQGWPIGDSEAVGVAHREAGNRLTAGLSRGQGIARMEKVFMHHGT